MMNSILQSPMSSKKKVSESTTNIRVAVRLRPMNKTEKEEKCTNIVKVDNLKMSVACKGKPFGPFFRVYDSDISQSEVYDDLVSSQVKKVIAGFNCTVFAYGQTGTGKTFTMEGGRTDAKNSKEDETTGIIPRAVEDIFEQLEKMNCEEYSLRVSYVELYNEELFDLLAVNSDAEDRERLRIFDDPNKKGVIVSGVEEVPVRNRADVYKLLETGAEKRRTAATMMNMRSSRSHSLFMVNVVVRENTLGGEELVKQGKLNLVDLAGSENIGRSGAQGSRAKEAGSINQSLLTLGRVIRSLTTNAQHIPYRESKLTRLLQDSLGGSTITSLIATLSPASSNFEESQSTLEYAMRAANIKNKPQCNTKVSKKTILKEYSDEIEKLRRDLRAAREKNGVIISQESHDELQRNTEKVHELEEQLDSVVDRLKRFTEDLMHMDEQYKKLYDRKGELEDRLKQRIREMAEKEKELADTKDDLATYKNALDTMYTSASQIFYQLKKMRNSAEDMRIDLKQFWTKVDDMKQADDQNYSTVEQLLDNVREFVSKMSSTSLKYVGNAKILAEKVAETSDKTATNIKSNSEQVWNCVESFEKDATKYSEALILLEKNICDDVSKETAEAKTLLADTIALFNKNNSILSDVLLKLIINSHEQMNVISEKVDEFKSEIIPLIGDLREGAEKDLARREEDRNAIDQFINQKKLEISKSLKLALELVEQTPIALGEMLQKERIGDEESRETLMSTTGTIQDVIQSMEDDICEATSSRDEDRKEGETKISEMKQSREVTMSEIMEKMTDKMDKIDVHSSSFVQNSKCQHEEFKNIVDQFVPNQRKMKEEQEELSIVTRQHGLDTRDEFQQNGNEFEKSSSEMTSNIQKVVDDVALIRIDPEENVPGRITAKVYTESELNVPPEPETLVTEKFDNDGDLEISEHEFARKKRRVTGFMRRDSLLDSTNHFMSPSTILKKREEPIDEENEENY